jgi:hypothetical protein
MHPGVKHDDRVVDLAAYRSQKSRNMGVQLPQKREDAERLLNELAQHILAAVRVITTGCH